MLRGRESLVRLIGKRRRAISPRVTQLLNSNPDFPASSSTTSNVDLAENEVDQVACPVCGVSILGTDYNVNSHLDLCLKRGSKRKLTQCTLLQFVSSPKLKKVNDQIDKTSKEPINRPIFCANNICDESTEITQDSSICEDKCDSPVIQDRPDDEPILLDDQINMLETKDENLSMVLETYIVGRKFCDSVEIKQGASIILMRDPQNSKDQNAIKVASLDLEMLGYLPRELARHMAPLLDNNCIDCQGSVISLPEKPHDAVPIQLNCQKEDEKYSDFESCWKNVLVTVHNGKIFSPNLPKYQKNFVLLIDDVMKNHSHLFTHNEISFIGSFKSLSDDGQRLFIRLFTRKAEELQLAGYFSLLHESADVAGLDMKDILALLNVSELKEILHSEFSKERIKCTRQKELINAFISAYENRKCPKLPKKIVEITGNCVRITPFAEEVLWRVQRLFFLNGKQDLSAFLLVDIGLMKYPSYVCHASHPIFPNRKDLLEYEEAIQLAQVMDESLEENDMKIVERCIEVSENYIFHTPKEEYSISSPSVSNPRFFSSFKASHVYSKILTFGVSIYERDRRYEDAIRILRGLLEKTKESSKRGYWTLRLSINLEHVGQLNESLLVCENGVCDEWVRAGFKMAIMRRVLRLSKPPRRWKVPSFASSVKRDIPEITIRGRPVNGGIRVKNLFYGYNNELIGVEELALQYYALEETGGWRGTHSESGVWLTIFGLLMWDIVFSDLPDVFCSKFQTAPLDLGTDDFYESRKDEIESQLKKIEEGIGEEILITCWHLHFGEMCRGVNWEKHSLEDLRAVVSLMDSHCLASLCRHLALDYRSWSSGMPDLLLWRFYNNTPRGEIKLVEVKGPRDRLSEQQRAWMLVLMDCGFNSEVCKVSPDPKSQD
ncbi:hypothetical protein LUZ60_004712 [Juncus effusus]|nr:hypothetical protein LUZ60_004712 [Juncus effusus]